MARNVTGGGGHGDRSRGVSGVRGHDTQHGGRAKHDRLRQGLALWVGGVWFRVVESVLGGHHFAKQGHEKGVVARATGAVAAPRPFAQDGFTGIKVTIGEPDEVRAPEFL